MFSKSEKSILLTSAGRGFLWMLIFAIGMGFLSFITLHFGFVRPLVWSVVLFIVAGVGIVLSSMDIPMMKSVCAAFVGSLLCVMAIFEIQPSIINAYVAYGISIHLFLYSTYQATVGIQRM